MMLHENTVRLLKEMVAGQKCKRCHRPAERVWRNQPFCQQCFPGNRLPRVEVYKISWPRAGEY